MQWRQRFRDFRSFLKVSPSPKRFPVPGWMRPELGSEAGKWSRCHIMHIVVISIFKRYVSISKWLWQPNMATNISFVHVILLSLRNFFTFGCYTAHMEWEMQLLREVVHVADATQHMGRGVKDMQYTTAQSTIITWNVWEKRIDSTKDVAFLFWLAKWLLRWGAPFILIQSLPFCNILQCFLSRRYKTPQRLQHIHFQNARNLHGPFWALAPCFYFRLDCSDFSMCWKVTACVSSDWPLYNFKQVLLGQQSEWIKPIATTSCPKVG